MTTEPEDEALTAFDKAAEQPEAPAARMSRLYRHPGGPLVAWLLDDARLRHHSAAKLAQELGVSIQELKLLERGQALTLLRHRAFIASVARYLGIPPITVRLLTGDITIRDFATVAEPEEVVTDLCLRGRGRSLERTIEDLRPILRGWMNYFQHTQGRHALEELDAWIRRRLRVIAWRQWKRPRTRESRLRALGLGAQRAWKSSVNGRGPWWNAGASHMTHALPPKHLANLGLVSLVDTHQRLQCSA